MISKLRLMIDKSGYKQKHFAALIGVDDSIMSKMISGDRPLTSKAIKILAKALKVKESEIK